MPKIPTYLSSLDYRPARGDVEGAGAPGRMLAQFGTAIGEFGGQIARQVDLSEQVTKAQAEAERANGMSRAMAALRRSIDVFEQDSDPIYVAEGRIRATTPKRFDSGAVKATAKAVLTESDTVDDASSASSDKVAGTGAATSAEAKKRMLPDAAAVASVPEGDGQRVLAEMDLDEGEHVRPVATIMRSSPERNAALFSAYPGKKVVGRLGGNNQPTEHEPLHFHLKLPGDGKEGVRFLAETFEVFPGDEHKVTREHIKVIKNLTEAQRWYIPRATRDIFETGGVSPRTREGLMRRTMRGRPPRSGDDS